MKLKEKFEKKFVPEPNTGCWLWLGQPNTSGYGCFTFNKKNDKAHRVSYSIYRGEIPDGLYVCHSCDVRSCVNPDHLWIGTHADNMRDMYLKKRAYFNKGLGRGSNNAMALLTEDIVLKIREGLKIKSGREVAKEFGTSDKNISSIKLRKTWKHI